MATAVGTLLKKAREDRNIHLEKASEDLKIHQKFLEALEAQDFSVFSSQVHITGFLKNYSEYLGLDAKQVSAFYRRDFGNIHQTLSAVRPLGVRLPWATPDKIAGALVVVIFLSFFSYLIYQYSLFVKLPTLIVENPPSDAKVKSVQIVVSGRASPGSVLKINGQEINAGGSGSFSENISLKIGANTLIFTATNKAGRVVQVVRNIISEP
jgi:cytoskeletal protein RodZ